MQVHRACERAWYIGGDDGYKKRPGGTRSRKGREKGRKREKEKVEFEPEMRGRV